MRGGGGGELFFIGSGCGGGGGLLVRFFKISIVLHLRISMRVLMLLFIHLPAVTEADCIMILLDCVVVGNCEPVLLLLTCDLITVVALM